MTTPVRTLCSMATKGLLAELGDAARGRGLSVDVEPGGGVEVVRAIRAGATADLAVLGAREMSDLDAGGWLHAGTRRPLFVSDVVAAVPDGAHAPILETEADLRAAVTRAGAIAYSTGPSGTALLDLLTRWDLAAAVTPKLVQAEPGHPVGDLLAAGRADLGFQQRSELSALPGVQVLGPLPGTAAIRSTFSGAVLARATDTEAARAVLTFFASAQVADLVTAAGMTPA